MKLWLVRHAAVQVEPGVCYGALDLPADAQATQHLAHALAQALPLGIALRSSVLQRCELLAQCLCRLRPDLAYKTDTRLIEMNFGQWEGQTWDAIGPEALQTWTDNFMHHPPGGQETVAQMLERVGAALREAQRAAHDAVWITHAGVINTVHTWLEPVSDAAGPEPGVLNDLVADQRPGTVHPPPKLQHAPDHATSERLWRLRAQCPLLRPQNWPRSPPLGSWEALELSTESPR